MYMYVLELEDNKYYIDITKESDFNVDKFFWNDEVNWTIKYRPIKLLELIPYDDAAMIQITLKYINEKLSDKNFIPFYS